MSQLDHARTVAEDWCRARGDTDLAELASPKRSERLSTRRQALALFLNEQSGIKQAVIAELLDRSPASICRAIKVARKRRDRGGPLATPAGMKWCPRCNDWRPYESFNANRATADGLASYCRKCNVAQLEANRRRAGMRVVPKGRGRIQQNMRLDPETADQLHEVADRLGITMSEVVEGALKPLLPKLLNVCLSCRSRPKADDSDKCVECIAKEFRSKRGRWTA